MIEPIFSSNTDGKLWDLGELLREYTPSKTPKPVKDKIIGKAELANLFGSWIRRKNEHLKDMGRAGRAALAGEQIAESGERDTVLHKLACQIIDAFPTAATAPIEEMFSTAIAVTFKNETPPSFKDKLDRHKKDIEAKTEERKQKRLDQRSADIKHSFGNGRDYPATTEELTGMIKNLSIEDTPERLSKFLLITKNRFFFVARPDGSYTSPHSTVDLQSVAARDLAVFDEFDPWTTNAQGEPRKKSSAEILTEYGEVYSDLHYDLSAKKTAYDTKTKTIAVAPCPPRFKAKEHPEVQRWLDILDEDGVATDMASTMARLDIIAPAVAMVGDKSTGKTLFAMIAAQIYAPTWTRTDDFSSDFNSNILKCPVVVGDEVPGKEYTKSGSSFVRSHLSVLSRTYNEKYQPKGFVEGAIRMFFLSNKIENLSTKEDLTDADIEALCERFVFLFPKDESKKYLERLGGKGYIDANWINKGSKGPEHFLWLAENHTIKNPGKRFAVEGDTEQFRNVVFGSQGVRGELITFLINFMASIKKAKTQETGFIVKDGALYVQAFNIHRKWGAVMSDDKSPGQAKISSALRGGLATSYKFLVQDNKQRRFHKVNTDILRANLSHHLITEADFDEALGIERTPF